jgi:hypothetical protein
MTSEAPGQERDGIGGARGGTKVLLAAGSDGRGAALSRGAPVPM